MKQILAINDTRYFSDLRFALTRHSELIEKDNSSYFLKILSETRYNMFCDNRYSHEDGSRLERI